MITVAAMQPQFFPWPGFFEQIQLADIFVLADDFQYSRRNFGNRVQIKTATGQEWFSVPLQQHRLGQCFNEIRPSQDQDWRGHHKKILRHSYERAPFGREMLALVQGVYEARAENLADLNIRGIAALSRWLGLTAVFRRTSELGLQERGSRRVLEICRALGASVYITGHGGGRYLDHHLMESHGIEVRYMAYRRRPYPQLHGPFEPHVSALDLIANVGEEAAEFIGSPTIPWREFVEMEGGSL